MCSASLTPLHMLVAGCSTKKGGMLPQATVKGAGSSRRCVLDASGRHLFPDGVPGLYFGKQGLEAALEEATICSSQHHTSNLPPSLLQMRVSGLQFGKWGRDKYGTKPVKVDTIEFLADRLQELEKEIKEQQVGQDCCGHPNLSQITSCACWTRAVSHTC